MACFLILLLPKDYVYAIGVKIGSLPLQILLLQRGIHHRVHGEHRVFRVLCALCDLCGSKKKCKHRVGLITPDSQIKVVVHDDNCQLVWG
jgi:hypothetical protein